jgi:hypothetical protein
MQTLLTFLGELGKGANLPAQAKRLRELQNESARWGANHPDPTSPLGAAACQLALLRSPAKPDKRVLHYLSFLLIAPSKSDPKAYVLLEVNADGSASSTRKLLDDEAPALLKYLFENCPEFERYGPRRFLQKRGYRANATFTAAPGATVEELRANQGLRRRVRDAYLKVQGAVRGTTSSCPYRPAQRISPTSATAIWQTLQETLDVADKKLVKEGVRRPWIVRFSPVGGRLQSRLNGLGTWVGVLAGIAAGGCGIRHAAVERGPWLWWCGGLLALWFLIVFALWTHEAPRSLGLGGFLRVFWAMVRSVVWETLVGALVIGAGALSIFALTRLTLPVAILSLLFTGSAYFALSSAGVPKLGSALVGLLVLAGAFVKLPMLPMVPFVVCEVIGIFVALAAWFVVFVLDGVWVARLSAVIVALLWGPIAEYTRELCYGEPAGTWGLLPALALALMAVGVAWRVVRWLYKLRLLEASDVPGKLSWELEGLEAVEDMENRGEQNHLAHVATIKPEPIRLTTLRRVLRLVDVLAGVWFTQGDLASIHTIHFARFMILPKNKRLLFLGNYDGAFSSYLQEFNSVWGVTAVWSNCVGFPRSTYLFGDGATDEQRFKAFGRRYQVPTLGWFSAYPDLSVLEINAGTFTREDLARRIEDPWTLPGKLRSFFGRPISEAGCDDALRRL